MSGLSSSNPQSEAVSSLLHICLNTRVNHLPLSLGVDLLQKLRIFLMEVEDVLTDFLDSLVLRLLLFQQLVSGPGYFVQHLN